MDLPISSKLRALLREVEAERLAKRGKRLPEEELKEQKARAREAQAEAKQAREGLAATGKHAKEAERRAEEAERRAARAERRAEEAERRATRAEQAAEAAERKAIEAAARVQEQTRAAAKGGLAPGGFERATGVAEMEGVHALIRPAEDATASDPPAPKPASARSREAAAETAEEVGPTEKPAGKKRAKPAMPELKLSPAEIQSLLRSGRGVRSVAKQAEAPVDWVRRLAAPIEAERLGVVTQLLQSYLVRARLGRSALPVGQAIVENLRDKGIRFPERVVEDGWTAWRPDNREWRVRFVYESRGRKQRADWRFEPQSRSVAPQNDLAQELAYRPAADGDRTAPETPSTMRRSSSRKASARKRSSAKRASRKRSASTSSRRRSAGSGR